MNITEEGKDKLAALLLGIMAIPGIYIAWHLGIFQVVTNWTLGIFQVVTNWTVSHIAWLFEHWGIK